jgi:hypothetical protein
MTAVALIDKHARRRPEPEERRSHQPVRRNSRMAEDLYRGWESRWTRKGMTWREKHELVKAARAYDRANKKPGARHGPLGPIAIELLEELCYMAVSNDGRLYPTLDWMQQKLRRSRDTVVRVMRALADAQILQWIRRLVPVEDDGKGWGRGPRVKQTSSVYRIQLPARLRKFVRRKPPAADEAHRKAEMRATIEAHIREEAADRLDAIPAVARANAKAASDRRKLDRESDDPAQTVHKSES